MFDMTPDTMTSRAPELPHPLLFSSGSPVQTVSQWRERRREIRALMVPVAYGELPPVPAVVQCAVLHTAAVKRIGGARLLSCRVVVDGGHAFLLRIFVPVGAGPFPVVLHGDGCWHYASDEVIAAWLGAGYVFAQFNRVELAPDVGPANDAMGARAASGVHPGVLPADCPALAAWAWGYHRAVDALFQLDFVDQDCLAVVGHSRGGKAALLAGACDERIALTSANDSGAGGAGCFRMLGPGAETLADVLREFPHWFSPALAQFAGREDALPFDQHFLKALIAPRALLTTEALQDHWANPLGTWLTHLAAREVYAFLGVPDRIAISYRDGGHEHGMADWLALLDFCESVFRGKARADNLQVNPFPDSQARFTWAAAP
jgi:hypothetical protein